MPRDLIRAPDADAIQVAAAIIRRGGLVAVPTETVYGLGADATQDHAVARIFQTKGRPRFNPLIVHVPDLATAAHYAEMSPLALHLARAFWPGPLTLVLHSRPGTAIADLVTAGLDTVAIRVPAHRVAQALLRACERPIAAPSANRSGHVSATTAAHVASDLGDGVDLILDDGPSPRGLESTIIDLGGEAPILLRAGAVPRAELEAALDRPLLEPVHAHDERPVAPGRLASHYAPAAQLRLNAVDVRPGEAVLAFGPVPLRTSGALVNLSATGDLVEAAARLFAALRTLDDSGAAHIAAMPIPDHGLGEAINDRLARAAAPRRRTALTRFSLK
jgi:L-threonylcarbamoyladenylate synthase